MRAKGLTSDEWRSALEEFRWQSNAFVRVGARGEGDWVDDALRVMRRETTDPLGWSAEDLRPWFTPDCCPDEDFDRAWEENEEEVEASLPFWGVDRARMEWLCETSRPGARLTIQEVLGGKTNEEVFWAADVVISRFPEPARYFTSISELEGPGPEYPSSRSIGGITQYMLDCGVIVVTSNEVGVIWGFEED